MPLGPDNYENFFLGAAAEFRIASEVYFHGFEANKYTPDFGVDLAVTNAARVRFKGEAPWLHHLQVKATCLVPGAATFHVSQDELEDLKSQPDVTTVFCCVVPHILPEPHSFSRGDFEPWRPALEADGDRQDYDERFAALKKQHGCLSAIEFKGFDFLYFWLNAAQLRRSVDEACWTPIPVGAGVTMRLRVTVVDGGLHIATPYGALRLVNELSSLYYLLKPNASTTKLEAGGFAQGD